MTFLNETPNSFQLVPLALYITAAVYAFLGIYTLRQRAKGVTASYLAWMMLAMAWWSASYGMEIHVPELSAKIFWVKIEYPGVVAIPVFWLFFVLEYIRQSALLTRHSKAFAALIPLLTVLAMWTNEFHGLIYSELHIAKTGDLTLLVVDHGWFFWVYLVYSYLLLGGGSLLLLFHTFRSPSLYRAQAAAILLATLSPWLGNAISVADLLPITGLDITPFAFIPTGIVLTWAIARYHLLDIVPPQQNIILQSLSDGVIVLDARRRVLYMNRSAENILSQNADRSLGQPAELVCEKCAPIILPLLGKDEQCAELVLKVKGETRYFEIQASLNYFTKKDRTSETPSHLIIFHDITSRKQTQADLKYREAILQAVSLASKLFLKSVSWEQNIHEVLERLGEAAAVSRVYIFERHFSEAGVSLISQQYEWVRAGIPPQIDKPDLQNLDWRAAGFARWDETFRNHEIISGLVCEFPASERELLATQEILSIVVVPVFIEDDLWGFIGFNECAYERNWSGAELDALRAAADIFGAALTRRNVEKRLLNRQRSLNLLQEIIRAALGKGELQEIGLFLVDHLGSLIGADHCFLALWDEAGERTIPLAAYGVSNDLYRNMHIQPGEKTLTASALETGHLLIVEDAQDSSYVSLSIARLFGTRSVLAIPMISNEKKLGAVLLGFVQPHRFTPEEIIVSEQAADLVALALAKFQAVDQAQRRAEEAETLRRAGVAISETLNLQEATTRILEQLAYVVPHDSASVQLLRDGELEIIGGEGWADPASIIGVRFPVPGNNPNTVVLETRKPYVIHDTHEAFPEFGKIAHASHIRSWLGVPLIVRNQVIGLLAIDSREKNHFSADNAELVTAFAGQVAIAIENTRLFNEVQQLAITDGLTGLYNRRHFLKLAQNEFERARRYKRHLSAMMFDIDHFKIVNDTYGHPFGDKILQALANLCKEKLREVDPIARYGGEEFIALIVEASLASAQKAGERLRREVEKMTVPSKDGNVKVTVSVGIAEQNEVTPNLETLIARADQAMYVAKHKGRNRVAVGR
jgi:diguanylate cyclase (GGDEF)-like protein